MGESYFIHPGTLEKDPKLVICGLKKEHADTEILEMLKTQNDIDCGVKVVKIFESRKAKNRLTPVNG